MRLLSPIILLIIFAGDFSRGQNSLQDAKAFIEKRQYNEARPILENLLKQNNNNAEVHSVYGTVLRFARDFDNAEEHFEKAVELDDNNAEYHFLYGEICGLQAQHANIFRQMSYVSKIKNNFQKAAELKPTEIKYHDALLEFYLRAPGIVGGSVAKAKEEANAMFQILPIEGHIARARIAVYENNYQIAEEEYKKAIQENTKSAHAHHVYGYFLLDQKRYDEAIKEFQSYVAIAPADANSYDSLGEGYLANGDYDNALAQFKKSLEVDPQFEAAQFHLGLAYEKKNMKTEAIHAYQACISISAGSSFAKDSETRMKDLSN